MQTYDFGSLFDVQFGMDKKARIITGQSGSSHGMALVGVDLDENGKVKKWLLENSWGPTAGHNGYLIMTDPWFDNYMFRIVVNKAFVPEKYMKILKQKPTMLPPWDPMFKNDN
jgi:bleomycin hydrolase